MTTEEYLKSNQMIGFTQSFPVLETIETENVSAKCRNFNVNFNVHLVKVGFGDNNKYNCLAIVTDKVDISYKLPLNGWNSYCCYDEAETMEKALVEFAEKKGYILCNKVCSWPFAKAIVSKR